VEENLLTSPRLNQEDEHWKKMGV